MEGTNFADLLADRVLSKSSQVIVGLDPVLERLPEDVAGPALAWHGRTPIGAAEAIIAFNRAVIDAVAEHAVGVKLQIAFFERFGLEGMRAYADAIRYARGKGLIVIGDVKRGDIAGTAAAYAAAHLGATSPEALSADDFVADAVTVNPYLGSDGVRPFIEAAAANGRGLFVLVKTSNPSSAEAQDLDCGGAPLYERIGALVAEWGEPYRGRSGYSLVGAVVGATFPTQLVALRRLMPHSPFLVPGFGAQGAGVDDVIGAFDSQGLGAVVSSSRGIIYACESPPYRETYGASRWCEAVRAAACDMRRQLWQATH
jgi:orotidine-5'-phosphate decarboxylase